MRLCVPNAVIVMRVLNIIIAKLHKLKVENEIEIHSNGWEAECLHKTE